MLFRFSSDDCVLPTCSFPSRPLLQDALFSVAEYFFKTNPELGLADVQTELCQICVTIHSSVSDISVRFFDELRRYNYTTPTSYLELISSYTSMLMEQRNSIQSNIKRYGGGYVKLQDTNQIVEQLKVDLIRLQPVLAQAAIDTAALMVDVERDQKEAAIQAEQCGKDAAECEKTASEVQVIKDDCQKDLEQAMPAVEDAVRALNTLNKDHIGEVKRFASPPAMVSFCLEAVCILFGRKPTWPDAQKLLGEFDFLDKCKGFDRDNIAPAIIKKLDKYVKNPDFTAEKMASVSTAATSLCKWVRAMNIYSIVAKEIEPKKKALAGAEATLAEAQSTLNSKQESLRVVQVCNVRKLVSLCYNVCDHPSSILFIFCFLGMHRLVWLLCKPNTQSHSTRSNSWKMIPTKPKHN